MKITMDGQKTFSCHAEICLMCFLMTMSGEKTLGNIRMTESEWKVSDHSTDRNINF